MVLGLCTKYLDAQGRELSLDALKKKQAEEKILTLASQGTSLLSVVFPLLLPLSVSPVVFLFALLSFSRSAPTPTPSPSLGLRVLCLACSKQDSTRLDWTIAPEHDLTFVCFVGIKDPVRSDVPDAGIVFVSFHFLSLTKME